MSKQLKELLIKRDGPTCQWSPCRETENLTLHHLIPQALGGKTDVNNLVLLCKAHHELDRRFVRVPNPTQRNKLKENYIKAGDALYSTLESTAAAELAANFGAGSNLMTRNLRGGL